MKKTFNFNAQPLKINTGYNKNYRLTTLLYLLYQAWQENYIS